MWCRPGDEAQRSTQDPPLWKLLEGKVRQRGSVFDLSSHLQPSVKTNHELKTTLVPNKWNKDFGLELLPSVDDGESNYVVL